MTTVQKILFLILLTLTVHGQSKRNRPITTKFLDLDKIVLKDSIGSELLTDKIYFSKNNNLDTIKSKPILDSIVWFFKKHPDLTCEMTLKKGNEIIGSGQYRDTKLGIKQTDQISLYLSSKMSLQGVIVTHFIVCGSPIVTDEEMKKIKDGEAHADKTLRLSLFIFDRRQRDPNAPK
jgi:hypothetical protein